MKCALNAMPACLPRSRFQGALAGFDRLAPQILAVELEQVEEDRSAQGAKLAESFGGKLVAAFFFPGGSEFDGMVINEHPDDVTAAAQSLFVRATGNFSKVLSIPVMTGEEFKAAMEKAKNVKSSYTPPTATKQ
jgi:uncharacterized protein with GYD domain